MNTTALQRSIRYIESWIDYQYDYSQIPGMVVAISHKGKILMNKAYGYANVEQGTAMTPNHLFRIASHSKTFTATAIMQLQEKGALRIDDRATQHLPWLSKHKDQRWHTVTIRQLLSHRAGVIRDGVDSDYWSLERPFPDKSQLKAELLASPLLYDTNTKPKYTNYGYSVLGMIIEAVSGITYGDYVTKNIIDTIGLTNTGPEYSPKRSKDYVTGYSRLSRSLTRSAITSDIPTNGMAAATGFYSNAADLCRYFTAHFLGSSKLVSDESKKEMQRSHWHVTLPDSNEQEEYGLGIEIEQFKGRSTIGHGGGFPGQSTISMANPANDIVVVVLTNCMSSPSSIIATSIHNIIGFYQRYAPQGSSNKLARYEGRFSSLWSTLDIIAGDDVLIVTRPDGWRRLYETAKLVPEGDNSFRVTETSSYGDGGEAVVYHFTPKGSLDHIVFGGSKMTRDETFHE